MKITLLLAILSVAFCSAAQESPCGKKALPASINQILDSTFTSWRPQRVTDLYEDDQKFWLDSHSKECPGIASGHFESAESLSYAVLLVPTSEKQHGYRLIVFSASADASNYAWRSLESATGKDDFAPVIYKVLPGHHVGFDHTKSIRIKLDGIGVEWIEKSSYIYWFEGHYRKLWTSD
jgi:hypothetical protein